MYNYIRYAMDICDFCKQITGKVYEYQCKKSQIIISWFENGKRVTYQLNADFYLSIGIRAREAAKMICDK